MQELLDLSDYGEVVEVPSIQADPDNPEAFGGLPKQGDTGDKVQRVQQALADRNIVSVGEVDGAFGNKTSLGIQEFQEQVGLPRTGVLDQTTYTNLVGTAPSFDEAGKTEAAPVKKPEALDFSSFGEVVSVPAGEATTESSNLLDFIGKGEGGYDSANRGTIGGNVVGSQRTATRGGKKVSELTVAEIKKYQSITDPNNKDRLFTVGKYQAIPDTFNQAVKGLGLSDDTVFTPEVQEQVGLYLVSEKRPKVGQFIRGEGNISSDTAMIELAREFASIPVPTAIAKGTYGKWPKTNLVAGDSFYKNPKASKGNKAQHTVEETRAVLEAAKQ